MVQINVTFTTLRGEVYDTLTIGEDGIANASTQSELMEVLEYALKWAEKQTVNG